MISNNSYELRGGSSSKQTIITGVTLERGVPVSKPLRVYGRGSGVLLTQTHSDKNGNYKVYLSLDVAYTVVSIDPNKQYNAVIQDNIVPK